MDAAFDLSPPVRAWFERRFRAPTPSQEQGWPAIARGGDVLIAAPTGSGKTLTAFLLVIDRLVTQGSRSEAGRRWLERIWSVMATCAQTGRSAFTFLVDSVQAFFHDTPTPSLSFDTS